MLVSMDKEESLMLRLTLNDQYDTMPWEMIDAVVFDVGNVLLSFAPMKEIIQERLPEHPELHQLLLKKTVQSPYWIMLDHGTITQEEAILAMTGREKALEPYIRRMMGDKLQLNNALPEGVAALKACKAHGKKLYVLSNYHDAAFDYAVQTHEFFRLFDGFVVSARVGMVKPDPAIYRHMTETFRLEPARTLFIDDSNANVEAALHVGWQGLHYSEKGLLTKFFCEGENPQTLAI